MYTITKQFQFSAAHRLTQVPDGHPCGRLHGHNYIVEMVLRSADLTAQQWVRDYGELDVVKEFIANNWDHHNLNDWFKEYLHDLETTTLGLKRRTQQPMRNWFEANAGSYPGRIETTAEQLAFVMFDQFKVLFPELVAVRVSETPKTWAEYRHDD